MNEERLRIYLEDHLALLVGEEELVRRCQASNSVTPLAEFLGQLGSQIAAQRMNIEAVFHSVGGRNSVEAEFKKGMAWFAEKLGRLKLNDNWIEYSPLSRLLELEALTVAAQERATLWDNLETIATGDPRFDSGTYAAFRDQSQQHVEELNRHRRNAALTAFTGA